MDFGERKCLLIIEVLCIIVIFNFENDIFKVFSKIFLIVIIFFVLSKVYFYVICKLFIFSVFGDFSLARWCFF